MILDSGFGTRDSGLGLFTDLYELTMAQAYLEEKISGSAVFSLFVRRLPEHRNFLLACGIDSALAYLEQVEFTDADIAYLRIVGLFSERFLAWLRGFRFTGDVYAVPEGTPVFADEPILEIVAPIAQAQLAETLVMNQVQLQTMLASKAARVVAAAQGRKVIDFGTRRAHGIDAALGGARAFYIAGVDGTSNVLAGLRYGIPVAGTMAHSYIQAHEDEREAFRAFARMFPHTVLLVDTYDTLQGVRHAIEAVTGGPDPLKISAVRLDSGDVAVLARETRRLLDAAGLRDVDIFASGGLDEHAIAALLASGAPIDGFGVGTAMSVSADAPSLDIVYKLAEYEGQGRTKLSHEKPVLPGRKQVFRQVRGVRLQPDLPSLGSGGQPDPGDVIACWGEQLDGRPLLHPVMKAGQRLPESAASLTTIRARAAEEIATLPPHVTALAPADPPYPIRVSGVLERHHAEVRARFAGGAAEPG